MSSTHQALAVSGSVGDGPVANVEIAFEDANGEVVGTTMSDANAKHSFEIPARSLLPVTVRATVGLRNTWTASRA